MSNQYLQQLNPTTVASGSYFIPISDPGSGRLLYITKDNLFGGLYTQSSGYLNLNTHRLTLNADATLNQDLQTSSNVVFSTISGTWAGNPISETLGGLGIDTSTAPQGSVLYQNTSTWAVLNPGASGQILATQGTSQNPKWVNQQIVLLATASVNAQVSSVDMVLPASGNFQSYFFELNNVVPVTTSVLWLRTSPDSTNYDASATSYSYCSNENQTLNFSQAAAQVVLAGATITVSPSGNQGGLSGRVNLWQPSGVFRGKGLSEISHIGINDGICRPAYVSFCNKNVKPIQSVRFLFSTGNIGSGEFRLYGLTNN